MSNSNTEKRFTCQNCSYSTQVAGKRYYEIEWQFHIETRKCKSCNRLFDNIVTKTVTENEISEQRVDYNKRHKQVLNESITDEIDDYLSFLSTIRGHNKKIVNCRWCGSNKNEVWDKRNPECPVCSGKMKMTQGKIKHALKAELFPSFKEIINSAPKVIAFLTEPTCGICRNIQLVIAEIENEYPDEFRFVELEYEYAVDNGLTSKYNLRYFPTFLHFKNGKYIGKFSSVDSKPDFLTKARKRFENEEKQIKQRK